MTTELPENFRSTETMKMKSLFITKVKAMGVYVDCKADAPFIYHEDVTKQQQKQIAKIAEECKLTIRIADKGAFFV